MSGLLERILASKREEIERLRAGGAREAGTFSTRATRDVFEALRRRDDEAMRLIAEVKLKSPSAGALSNTLSPAERALVYARGGAAMVSVLCDRPFFGGSFEDLASARAALDREGLAIPLLAKEFVLDESQLDLARAYGADSVLIIVRILAPDRLARLIDAARRRSLEPFVEVTSEAELARALAAGARVVGVNTRDLDTLAMDPARAERVLSRVPRDRIAVHLSGLRDPERVAAAARSRADAALIGEAIMREEDPRNIFKRFVASARPY